MVAPGLRAFVLLLALGLVLSARPALAQEISIDLGDGQSFSLRTVQLLLLITLLSLAPGLAIMVTCFPFMVTVLSILRQAIGVQQAPPNMMIVSLALFLTWFVMEPVFTQAWRDGIEPMVAGRDAAGGSLRAGDGAVPDVHGGARRSRHHRDAARGASRDGASRDRRGGRDAALAPGAVLPAQRDRRGFEVGFLIFLPFLVIDLVIAAVLMSMGMMMVPPAVVSLPFKLAFFVIADGWSLLAGALVRSYNP